MKVDQVQFEGYACIRIQGGKIRLWVTVSAGPRVLGLSLNGGENLMAVLPGVRISYPGGDWLDLIGGHRLWYAPEEPETTYIPDREPVAWDQEGGAVRFVQPAETQTGIQKSMVIRVDGGLGQVRIYHRVTNTGETERILAPWAITQMRLGGLAVLPLTSEPADVNGLLPNRHVVFWPYTDLQSPFLKLTDQAVFIRTELTEGAIKVGAPNPKGWVAYAWNEFLFIKRAGYQAGAEYLDRDASSQVYCNHQFVELETLGPVARLGPGQSVEHKEIWELYRQPDWPEAVARLVG
jgi:hypothetical protein